MRIIGLTGGIATGKSAFAAALRAKSVPVIDADELARSVVEPGSPALAEIASAFGPGVLLGDGGLDRRRMAKVVFSDPKERRRLEAITHPAVRRAMVEETARLAAAGEPLAFYDAPLIFEVGLDALLDAVVVVYAPVEAQRIRLKARDGLLESEAEGRLAAQWSIEEKVARADFVVDNTGGVGDLGDKAERLLRDLRRGAGRRLPNGEPLRY